MVDAASGGAFMNNTLENAKKLINDMAENAQQFGTRREITQKVNEVSLSSTNQRLDELTSMMKELVAGKIQQVKQCGICAITGHATDSCPSLQEDFEAQVNAMGGFQNQPQRKYDPYSNTYNPGWRDHPNFKLWKPKPKFSTNTRAVPASFSTNLSTTSRSTANIQFRYIFRKSNPKFG
jgi:hypothetical protein